MTTKEKQLQDDTKHTERGPRLVGTSRSANLGGEWDAEVFLALGVEERKCKAEVIAK